MRAGVGRMKGRATIKDVAREAGVSRATVTNVLNRPDYVAAQTRSRVLDAIERVGYVRNESARALRAGRTRTFGLLILDVENPFFADVAVGVELAAEEAGAVVALYTTSRDPIREERLLGRLREQALDGVIVTTSNTESAALDQLKSSGTSVVILGNEVESGRFCSARTDDEVGGALGARHLLELGHRRIAFAGPEPRMRRDRGAAAALAGTGATLDFFATADLETTDGVQVGARLAAVEPEDRPTAVFCANDLIAVGLVQEARRVGLRVPEDLSIVGYDDTVIASAACAVGLTTVHQPAVDIGRASFDLVVAELDDPHTEHHDVVFQPRLVVRDSARTWSPLTTTAPRVRSV